ncbi:hypothetical protein PRZ48_000396 [Zasmidium cellare]|uniref:Uncharacterized protein n=1 Tax=Zasmidium cellare TaxID=395010 RepID=A0ABR0EYC9_ZASCE|nr:hypothetical protein PRZ48_000396 [Zasmidium cellare]
MLLWAWCTFICDIKEHYPAFDDELFVGPSGRLNAEHILLAHYPTFSTGNALAYQATDDPTNGCMSYIRSNHDMEKCLLFDIFCVRSQRRRLTRSKIEQEPYKRIFQQFPHLHVAMDRFIEYILFWSLAKTGTTFGVSAANKLKEVSLRYDEFTIDARCLPTSANSQALIAEQHPESRVSHRVWGLQGHPEWHLRGCSGLAGGPLLMDMTANLIGSIPGVLPTRAAYHLEEFEHHRALKKGKKQRKDTYIHIDDTDSADDEAPPVYLYTVRSDVSQVDVIRQRKALNNVAALTSNMIKSRKLRAFAQVLTIAAGQTVGLLPLDADVPTDIIDALGGSDLFSPENAWKAVTSTSDAIRLVQIAMHDVDIHVEYRKIYTDESRAATRLRDPRTVSAMEAATTDAYGHNKRPRSTHALIVQYSRMRRDLGYITPFPMHPLLRLLRSNPQAGYQVFPGYRFTAKVFARWDMSKQDQILATILDDLRVFGVDREKGGKSVRANSTNGVYKAWVGAPSARSGKIEAAWRDPVKIRRELTVVNTTLRDQYKGWSNQPSTSYRNDNELPPPPNQEHAHSERSASQTSSTSSRPPL